MASKRPKRMALILQRDGNACFVCRQPMDVSPHRHPRQTEDMATIEHIREQCEGGPDTLDNLALSHLRCNRERSRLNLFVLRFSERAGSPQRKWLMLAWPAMPIEAAA